MNQGSRPSQHLLFVVFLITDILTGVRRHIIVILICTSMVISDAENLFMCLLDIYTSSLEKYLFRHSTHFFNPVVCLFFSFFGCLVDLSLLQLRDMDSPGVWRALLHGKRTTRGQPIHPPLCFLF